MLKLLEKDIKINSTDGKTTIVSRKDLFPGWFDSDFKNYKTDFKGNDTKEINFEIYELEKSGTFEKIYKSLGVPLKKLYVTQGQIIDFVENHSDLLHPKGCGTFFLFEVNDVSFVAGVHRGEGGLKAGVNRFEYDHQWYAEHRSRFVFPQLDNLELESDSLSLIHSSPLILSRFENIEIKLDRIISHLGVK